MKLFPCGHARTKANTYQSGSHSPRCLTCKRERQASYKAQKRRIGTCALAAAWPLRSGA